MNAHKFIFHGVCATGFKHME